MSLKKDVYTANRPRQDCPDKVRILYFIPTFGTGGTEKVVFDLLSHLDTECYETHLCTFFPGECDHLVRSFSTRRHILVHKSSCKPMSPVAKVSNFINRLARLNLIFKREGIDIVHTHHLGPLLHVYCVLKGMRHRISWVHTEHNVPDLKEGYAQIQFRLTKPLRDPDFLTGVSSNVYRFLKNECRIMDHKVRLIPNGVNTALFAELHDHIKIRKEIGLAPEDEVIGCIGNLRKEKNHRLVLEAFSMIKDKRPSIKLLLCGDGECRSELEKLAYRLNISDHVVFLGYRFDIPRMLASMDIFCLPSHYEGMPLSVLEAWASGTPVIATDVIGIRDLVEHERNGILVPVDDAHRLAEGILQLFDNERLRNTICEGGRRRVKQEYSLTAMVENYIDLYERSLVT